MYEYLQDERFERHRCPEEDLLTETQ